MKRYKEISGILMKYKNISGVYSRSLILIGTILLVITPYIYIETYTEMEKSLNFISMLKFSSIISGFDILKSSSIVSDVVVMNVMVIVSLICSSIAFVCTIFTNTACRIIHIVFSLIGMIAQLLIMGSFPFNALGFAPKAYFLTMIISMIFIIFSKKINYYDYIH